MLSAGAVFACAPWAHAAKPKAQPVQAAPPQESLPEAQSQTETSSGSVSTVSTGTATPPVVKTHVDPVYPPAALAQRTHGDVMLALTIDADGHVSKVVVLESGGTLIDEAAVIAARQWTFVPAMRGNVPVASRIRVPFHFAPPEAAPEIVEPQTAPGDAPVVVAHEAVPAKGDAIEEVHVVGRVKPPSRGPSDFDVTLGELAQVPWSNAGAMLKLAPGVLITNEGGEGHADGINVRGFEAGEGEAMEISVGHLSLNEPGNYHAHGYADTHVILPELVESVRIQEGPFDPRQGNFAVAGSANYELGLSRRGLTAKYTAGSFGTQRMLLTYGPPKESDHTFAGAELSTSNGYGQNRDYKKANAIAQYEGKLGERGSYRVTTMAYAVDSHSAGVVRDDDVRAGRVGFYDSYDTNQGQDASRYSIAADLETQSGDVTLAQQLYLVDRSLRIREDFTGYAQDPVHGDGLDLSVNEHTIGGRGWARMHGEMLGQRQELEIGYFARGDAVDDVQLSVDRATSKPYATQASLAGTLGEVAIYGDANVHVLPWIDVRGGVRGELFTYDVNDRCANGNDCQTAPTPTNQRSTAALAAVLPRASLILGSFAGFRFTGSYGQGVRSLAIDEITQDTKGPLGRIDAYEAGVEYTHRVDEGELTVRSVFHDTHVDRDVIFSELQGRDVPTGGTTRTGWIGAGRFTGKFVDASASASIVKAIVDETHQSIYYVPQILVRSDTAFFGDLPWRLAQKPVRASIAPGVSYVGVRALPFGQTSDPYLLLDASASLSWTKFQLSVLGTNLFDARYRLSEFTFASAFSPGLTPTVARHFTAGAPRGVFVSLAVTLGD